MTRVLVVGSDTREEQTLLGRLREIAGLPPEGLQRCVDLDQCDLLLVRDTPALRSAAQHMASKRPAMRLWLHDDAGAVHDGRSSGELHLDRAQIQHALAPPPTPTTTDGLYLTSGAKQVTRLLRQRLQEKQGRAVLSLQGQPQLLIDFEHDQMVPLYVHPAQGPSLAQQLGDVFELLALQELSLARFQALAENLSRQPLRPLLWQMAQYGDNWTDFDRRLQQNARVSLLRWPDFRVLAHQHDGFRLCSLLLKKPCTLARMHRAAGTGQQRNPRLHALGLPVWLCHGAGARARSCAVAGAGQAWRQRPAGTHVAQRPSPYRDPCMIEHKVVILGAMGAGKSTLVRAVAGGTVIDTDVLNTDASSSKLVTTVAMDYADVSLPNGDRLRLYGTPGQERFSFIWPVLLQGARGVVILADASSPDVAQEMERYLLALREHAGTVPAVIGVSKFDLVPDVDLDACLLQAQKTAGRPLPLVPFDARSEDAVMLLMDVLMGEVEAAALVGAHD